MVKNYVVADEIGLHARPASLLVNEASKYQQDINIIYKGKTMTLKSILGIMSLGVPFGEEFSIEVVGEDEEVVFAALEKVLQEQKLV
jgi:phosphocarrier protein